MRDRLGRPLRDLRISVTDRCNLRCSYCMPADVFGPGFSFLPREELLSFEEIVRVVRALVPLGVAKVRLTGGEPLLRRGLERLVEMLAGVEGIADLALTTNGTLLQAKAQSLRDAGLRRVTVSLDALDGEIVRRMGGAPTGPARVLAGIEAACAAGLAPVKVNMVVRRGVNDRSVLAMAEHFRGSGHVLRFIEYMDVGTTNGWRPAEVVEGAEVLAAIDARWPLEPLADARPGEVARRFRYRDGGGEIGLINSVSEPFCGGCTRARLSSDGQLFTCLFASAGTDLRTPLRAGADERELSELIAEVWRSRRDRYSVERTAATEARGARVEMSYIGG